MYQLHTDYLYKKVGMQIVVLHYNSGVYWTLNETASILWQALMDGNKKDEIANLLVDKFDTPLSDAEDDVDDFIKDCISKGILIEQS